eukprot:TRINITY_DN50341_c0_g1_i1.p1 TRINITY_DN50341_c0_g1~~TRINITY_DN50341_c0_g1_i1.p1  ORF type:complete len:514 (-),score=85.73 TRINITY_DN50341_c0_g1_i1:59-1423(-)
MAISDDGQLVAVSSAKGTTHVFRLPPLHSAAIGHQPMETGAVRLTPTQPCASSAHGELAIGLSLAGTNAARPVNLDVCTRVRLGSTLLQEGLMPQCGFLAPSQSSSGGMSSLNAPPRMYVATRAGTLMLYTLTPSTSSSSPPGEGSSSSGAGSSGGDFSSSSEWQAVLTKEVHTCRPFRHFTEKRLGQGDLGGSTGTAGLRHPSPGRMSGDGTNSQRASPRLMPQASPGLGPRSPPLVPSRPGSPPQIEELKLPPSGVGSRPGGANAAAAASKWLSAAEMASHVPPEVPIWLCPQLSFHAYPADQTRADLNASLRDGRQVPGRKRIAVSRPTRPGDSVRYDGGSPSADNEERLSQLFGGALGAAVDDGIPLSAPKPGRISQESPANGAHCSVQPSRTDGGRLSVPTVAVGQAWGSIGPKPLQAGASLDVEEMNLQQNDGVGSVLEEVEEDWLKA